MERNGRKIGTLYMIWRTQKTRSSTLMRLLCAWLLELHAPHRRYIIGDVNRSFDFEKAMIESNITYRIWKGRKTVADITRYKKLRRQVNYLVRKSKKLYMNCFLDPNLPAKKLWRSLHYAHRKKWNDESTSIRLQIKPQPS
jgi:hypothetical protein